MATLPRDIFTPAADIDADRILAVWAWLLRKPFRLLGASAFGDLFLEDVDCTVQMLDLVGGELKPIASCVEEFEWGIGDKDQQQAWLMVGLVRAAAQTGIRPTIGQCLAFRTPPMFGGLQDTSNLVAWDLYAYHEGSAKLLAQALNLPLGTEIGIKPREGCG